MVTQHLKRLLLAFAMLPLLAQPVLAHSIWFDEKDGEYQLLFGHPEEGPEAYPPAKFQGATAYDKNKEIVPIEIINQGDSISVVPKGDTAALTGSFDNGFWVKKSEDNYENVSQSEAEKYNPDYEVGHYLKSTKALYDWSEDVSEPFNLPLEIMPLQNPFEVKVGETLPIQVLYQGNLINDPTVEYLGETLNVNEDGIAFIPRGQEGFQPIEAGYTIPLENNPAADNLSYATTLTAESVPEPSALLGVGAFGLLAFIGRSRLKKSSGCVAKD